MQMNTLCDHTDMALNLIDLKRYPISDLDHGEGAAFLQQCQQHIEENGWCSFEGFIRPEAVEALANEAQTLLPTANTLTVKRTIYQGVPDYNAPSDELRKQEYVHRALQLANDQIPNETLIQQLYQSPILTEFVRRVQKKSQLYRCADEFQALNVVGLQPDSWHAWHYDTVECTVTLLLQAAQLGGEFVFLPNSRDDQTEDTQAVDRLLSGDTSKAQTFSRGAGTFTFFRGGYSLHGVTKVEGNQERISAVLTYDEQPDRVLSDEVNIQIYGSRVAKILNDRNNSSRLK
jgi:hypothetical protein